LTRIPILESRGNPCEPTRKGVMMKNSFAKKQTDS
jgi:hypothetical protein